MKIDLIHTEGSGRLILIFAGWSTTPSFYSHIYVPGWDVAVAYGYDDFTFSGSLLKNYHTTAVFAWSMGVYAASRTLDNENVDLAIAVNGTEYPRHDVMGIPEAIFDGTAASLSDRNIAKFRKRMAGVSFPAIKERLEECGGDTRLLAAELLAIREDSHTGRRKGLRWHRAYISSDDAIFPAQAQKTAWESNAFRPEIIMLDAPHYIDLSRIISGIIPSLGKVRDKFRKALPSYENNAGAQERIAGNLARMCESGHCRTVLEIGPGTGFLTRLLCGRLTPESMTFIDLFPIAPFGLAPSETYLAANAEDWMDEAAEKNPGSMDAIVSASAIQWFSNPRKFFRNASTLLRKGGLLLCSTFLPGNLKELKTASPFGMVYHPRNEIEQMLEGCFREYEIKEEEFRLTFPSPRETLLHLAHTGVGGGMNSGKTLSRLLGSVPTSLTYRPLYIRAIN